MYTKSSEFFVRDHKRERNRVVLFCGLLLVLMLVAILFGYALESFFTVYQVHSISTVVP